MCKLSEIAKASKWISFLLLLIVTLIEIDIGISCALVLGTERLDGGRYWDKWLYLSAESIAGWLFFSTEIR